MDSPDGKDFYDLYVRLMGEHGARLQRIANRLDAKLSAVGDMVEKFVSLYDADMKLRDAQRREDMARLMAAATPRYIAQQQLPRDGDSYASMAEDPPGAGAVDPRPLDIVKDGYMPPADKHWER